MQTTLALLITLVTLTHAALTYKGVDWSSLLIEETAGTVYRNTLGEKQPFETILAASGVNTVRQRVWVSDSSDYNLANNVELAKRAQAAGLNIYLDLHYSDTWADPDSQTKPASWTATTIEDMTEQIYSYTKAVCNEFALNDVPISIVSIGNEIVAGLVWPLGTTDNWEYIAALLHSAAWGIKDSNLSTIPQIMIHISDGADWDTQEWWYSTVLAAGPLLSTDFDIMGVSFYPFYDPDATLASLNSSLSNMAAKYGKDIVVAETDWPTSCPWPKYPFPSDTKSIPFSAVGQAAWIKEIAKIVTNVTGGLGLFYWEPAWIDNAALGSSCASNVMVDTDGAVLSSMAVFAEI